GHHGLGAHPSAGIGSPDALPPAGAARRSERARYLGRTGGRCAAGPLRPGAGVRLPASGRSRLAARRHPGLVALGAARPGAGRRALAAGPAAPMVAPRRQRDARTARPAGPAASRRRGR
ncbi:MAG: hypothetical protein ACK5QX_00120, partial [bacterium]